MYSRVVISVVQIHIMNTVVLKVEFKQGKFDIPLN